MTSSPETAKEWLHSGLTPEREFAGVIRADSYAGLNEIPPGKTPLKRNLNLHASTHACFHCTDRVDPAMCLIYMN